METQKELKKEKIVHFTFGEEVVFFLIPIVGMMVYATTLNSNPEKARYALRISLMLIGIITGIWILHLALTFNQ